jgi:hypothetical protein
VIQDILPKNQTEFSNYALATVQDERGYNKTTSVMNCARRSRLVADHMPARDEDRQRNFTTAINGITKAC